MQAGPFASIINIKAELLFADLINMLIPIEAGESGVC